MFCIKTIALFFLLNGFEMPISATDEDWIREDHSLNDTNYDDGMTRDFPYYEFPGKLDYAQDFDENDGMTRDFPYYEFPGKQDIDENDGWVRGDHSLNDTNYDHDDWIREEVPDYFIESSKDKPSSAESEDWIREEIPDYFIESSKDKPSSAENQDWIKRESPDYFIESSKDKSSSAESEGYQILRGDHSLNDTNYDDHGMSRQFSFPDPVNEFPDSRSASEDYSKDKFAQKTLLEHNKLRRVHGVQPLKLNNKLSKTAQDWAETLLRENSFRHRPNNKFGENIYMSSRFPAKKPDPKEAVKSWYSEIKRYQFGVEPRSMETGHFTQIVWKSTTELGVGVASKDGKVIVVANYNPPGNYRGKYTENVPPPRKSG